MNGHHNTNRIKKKCNQNMMLNYVWESLCGDFTAVEERDVLTKNALTGILERLSKLCKEVDLRASNIAFMKQNQDRYHSICHLQARIWPRQ